RLGDVTALRFERQLLFLPADRALGELRRVVAGLGQRGGRHRRAVAAAAIEDHRTVLGDLLDPGGKLGEGDVDGAGKMPRLPLVVGADVDQLGAVGEHLPRLGAGDLLRGRLSVCHQTSDPSIRKATRTCARYSSRFSPRIPVETMSTARMLRSEPCACASACLAASSVEVLELPTSSMIFTTAISLLLVLVGPGCPAWRPLPPAARRAATVRSRPQEPPPARRRTRTGSGRSLRRSLLPRLRSRSSRPRPNLIPAPPERGGRGVGAATRRPSPARDRAAAR